jgi:hypothetical protein
VHCTNVHWLEKSNVNLDSRYKFRNQEFSSKLEIRRPKTSKPRGTEPEAGKNGRWNTYPPTPAKRTGTGESALSDAMSREASESPETSPATTNTRSSPSRTAASTTLPYESARERGVAGSARRRAAAATHRSSIGA